MHVEIATGLASYMIETKEIALTRIARGVKIFTLSSAHTAVRGAGAANLLIRLLQPKLIVNSS